MSETARMYLEVCAVVFGSLALMFGSAIAIVAAVLFVQQHI